MVVMLTIMQQTSASIVETRPDRRSWWWTRTVTQISRPSFCIVQPLRVDLSAYYVVERCVQERELAGVRHMMSR